jgi:thioredoxin 1
MTTALVAVLLAIAASLASPEQIVRVPLAYAAPADGPKPNFSPKGTQVPLVNVGDAVALPAGAARPAKSGTIKVGAGEKSWIGVLVTAVDGHPQDLRQLYVDRNRNGRFDDDGPAIEGTLTQNDKTKAWWASINKIELSVPYASGDPEHYMINVWLVREDGAPVPDVLRYSVASWRTGVANVNGVETLVAAMDSNNDAVFDKDDQWSVLEASAPDAPKAVLSIAEARGTSRLMYVKGPSKEQPLEFRAFSPDGRWIEFAVVDRPSTKASDRISDDTLRDERPRPRAAAPFAWGHDFNAALAQAKAGHKKLLIDFEATWCGPCKTMDEWIWTDAEVAGLLTSGFVGVKLDGDVEKTLVERFNVNGYPTMVVVDGSGKELQRAVGYLPSKGAIEFLKR